MNFGEACINYPSIMLLIEPETGNILEANKKAADTYGYSIEELKTMTILDINVLKKEQVVEEMRIAREESRNYFHFPHRTKNGFIIEMEVESYPTKIENKNILLSFIRPCEKRSYFNSAAMKLVQESRDIVVVLDQNCRIIRVNKKFEDILGYNEEKVIGDKIANYIKVSDNPEYEELENKLILGEVFDIDLEIENLNKEYRYANLVGIPTYFRDKFFGAVVSIRDKTVDAIKEIQKSKRLEEALKSAERYRKEKDEFYAKMSHDMRTPLNAVISYSDFGINESKNEVTEKYFQQIKESSEHLLGLLNDVLAYNKNDSGDIVLNENPTSNKEIVENVYNVIKVRANLKDIEVELNLDENIWDCQMFDVLRIKQIYLNVLNNAIKYSKPKGKIIWNQEYLYDKNKKPYFKNEIIDNGIGISKEFMKKMFEPYTRENNDFVLNKEGSGLGLAITKNLINLVGGNINCVSEVGLGTKIIVVIPAKELDEERCKKKKKELNYSFTCKRVLVFEDNNINYKIVKKILEGVGAKTENAGDGMVGISMLKENTYDAILMDIRMPIMDGIEATMAIRAVDKEIPIIGFSANADDNDVKKSINHGMDAHLRKPVEKEELYNILGYLLENGRAL